MAQGPRPVGDPLHERAGVEVALPADAAMDVLVARKESGALEAQLLLLVAVVGYGKGGG